MVSREPHWKIIIPVPLPKTKAEELGQMNRNRQTKGIWIVRRGFEPNRLSQETMAHAYEQIVTQGVRVLLTGEWSEKRRLTEQKGVSR